MANKKKAKPVAAESSLDKVTEYRFTESTRKNNPPAKIAAEGHTFASELLSKGVPITEVSERLGHADKNITLAIYSQAMPADSRAAAKVWNEALGDVIQASRNSRAD